MSLAEEMMADLEEGDEFEENDGDLEEVGDDVKMEESELGPISAASVRKIAKLRDSQHLADVMDRIEVFSKIGKRDKIDGVVEADPEYQQIVEANSLMVEIDNEINVIHKYCRDIYSIRLPELESLVPAPLDYMKTVQVLGNEILEKSKNNPELQSFLTPATIMVVSVTASTTPGQRLTEDELTRATEACQMALELTDFRSRILTYVESRMTFIAPNMTIVVGATTAAQLMGHAGGLTNLSKMPSCNIQVLGAQRKNLSGLSSASAQPHTGYIFRSEMVQRLPPDIRMKAAGLVADKCTLAARVDSFHSSHDGQVGRDLLAEVEKRLDKLMEPPPVKQVKALPLPIEPPAKKRGGRRYRKMKERLGLTELRKATNRVFFGGIEGDAYDNEFGIAGSAAGNKYKSGRLKMPVADAKTKARVSKALAQKLHKHNQAAVYGGSTTVKRQVAGTASSIAFTPLQGLEILTPMAAEKKTDDGKKYFSKTAGFLNLKSDL